LEFKRLVKDLNKAGKTIVVTSHLLADLQEICTSIAILEKGRLLRAGKLEQILKQPDATTPSGIAIQSVRIKLAAAGFDLMGWLARQRNVAEATKIDSGVQFNYAGTDADLAKLIQELVAAGAPICGVEHVGRTLEEVYSKITRGEVM
jgi:ABC-2 type transport system ATP-binding protein